MTRRLLRSVLAVTALGALAACNPFAGPAAGSRLFSENCVGCHGDGGQGGPGGPDLTGIAEREGGFPRRAVLDRLDGYARGLTVHVDSEAMPDMSHLMTGRLMHVDLGPGAGRMVPERVVALTAYLESIQR